MHEEPGAEKLRFVHGRIVVDAVWLGHAWIETGDDRVYDPVEDRYTTASDYPGVAERRYSRREATKLMMHARRSKSPYLFGLWHASDVRVEHLYDPTPEGPLLVARAAIPLRLEKITEKYALSLFTRGHESRERSLKYGDNRFTFRWTV
jgi:hypothetical protein